MYPKQQHKELTPVFIEEGTGMNSLASLGID